MFKRCEDTAAPKPAAVGLHLGLLRRLGAGVNVNNDAMEGHNMPATREGTKWERASHGMKHEAQRHQLSAQNSRAGPRYRADKRNGRQAATAQGRA